MSIRSSQQLMLVHKQRIQGGCEITLLSSFCLKTESTNNSFTCVTLNNLFDNSLQEIFVQQQYHIKISISSDRGRVHNVSYPIFYSKQALDKIHQRNKITQCKAERQRETTSVPSVNNNKSECFFCQHRYRKDGPNKA